MKDLHFQDKVFVTDALQRKSLAVVRSLGQKGIWVGAGDATRFSPTVYSRYCRQSVVYPSAVEASGAFAEFLSQWLKDNEYNVLLPMDDATLLAVLEHRSLFKFLFLPLLPDETTFRQVLDKGSLLQLAEETGVTHPTTYQVKDEGDLDRVAKEAEFPLLVRPRISSGGRGLALVHDRHELAGVYRRVAAKYPQPIIQQYLPQGDKYDVVLLYDRAGEPVVSFVQKELRHFPLEWGPSTAQESVRYPELVDLALRLLAPLQCRGLMEVEFMLVGSTPFLMEVNPRFYSSLQLIINCGIDLPYLMYQLAKGEQVERIEHYPAGMKSRWLWPGDLFYLAASLARGRKPIGFCDRRAIDDFWDLDDWRPVLGLMLALVRSAFDIKMWKMVFFRQG